MRYDYEVHFDPDKCMETLGLDDGGRVQKAVDDTFLRGVEPYVPMDTGLLIDSGIRNTVSGSGEIIWDVEDKARRLYYGEKSWNWQNGGVQEGGLRGPYWADRYCQEGGIKQLEEAARKAVKQ